MGLTSAAKTHYHIRWESGLLDWEPWDILEDARRSAEQLRLQDETFAISSFDDGSCLMCLCMHLSYRLEGLM